MHACGCVPARVKIMEKIKNRIVFFFVMVKSANSLAILAMLGYPFTACVLLLYLRITRLEYFEGLGYQETCAVRPTCCGVGLLSLWP